MCFKKHEHLPQAGCLYGKAETLCVKPINDLDRGLKTLQLGSSSSTSQKHRNFVAEPMGEKAVTDLAGIGDVLGKRLESKGFDKAYVVLGQFLLLKKNKDLFVEWIKDLAGANTKQSGDCYQCLSDWCDEFL